MSHFGFLNRTKRKAWMSKNQNVSSPTYDTVCSCVQLQCNNSDWLYNIMLYKQDRTWPCDLKLDSSQIHLLESFHLLFSRVKKWENPQKRLLIFPAWRHHMIHAAVSELILIGCLLRNCFDWPNSPCEFQGHDGKWLCCKRFIRPWLWKSRNVSSVCAGWAASLNWMGAVLDPSSPVCSQLLPVAPSELLVSSQ